MESRKTTAEMLGEFLREAAVLLLVFALLEPYFKGELGKIRILGALGLSVIFLTVGILVERRRRA